MNSDLCIGIAASHESLEIAALQRGQAAVLMKFPASDIGLEEAKAFLTSYRRPMRLAVAGVAALSLALAVGNVPYRETFIVATSVADQAVALANYARQAA